MDERPQIRRSPYLLYEDFLGAIEAETGKRPKHGIFGDHMEVSLVNDGPVTIIIDTKIRE